MTPRSRAASSARSRSSGGQVLEVAVRVDGAADDRLTCTGSRSGPAASGWQQHRLAVRRGGEHHPLRLDRPSASPARGWRRRPPGGRPGPRAGRLGRCRRRRCGALLAQVDGELEELLGLRAPRSAAMHGADLELGLRRTGRSRSSRPSAAREHAVGRLRPAALRRAPGTARQERLLVDAREDRLRLGQRGRLVGVPPQARASRLVGGSAVPTAARPTAAAVGMNGRRPVATIRTASRPFHRMRASASASGRRS